MAEVKHTPGLCASMKDGRIYEVDFGPCVAQVFFVDDRPPSDFLNRLAIFTAAPDLFEALEAFSREYDGFEDGNGDPCPVLKQARAALSKATTQQEGR